MKILNFSIDERILDDNSSVSERLISYGSFCKYYDILVTSKNKNKKTFSPNISVYGIKKSPKILSLFNFLIQGYILCSKRGYDLITTQDPYFIGFVALFLSKLFGSKLEVQIHGFEKFFSFRKIIFKLVINNADSIRVVSQRLKNYLINNFNIEADRIVVIPIFTKININIEQNFKKISDKFIFLTIGRLVPIKDIALQIMAFRDLTLDHDNLELHIVGDGPEKNNLETLVKDLGISDKVRFFGYQTELNHFYDQANVFMLTSQAEGWGMVVIEAAAHNLPIIMTDVGCAGEVIKNNESGLVIPVSHVGALKNAMKKMLNNADFRKRVSRMALLEIKKLPNRQQNLTLYFNNWSKIINKKPSKILIITQKIDQDDSVLGFFHFWIKEFSRHSIKIIALCLESGKYDLPDNVNVISLGKERKKNKIYYLKNFYQIIWKKRNEYDWVFVHMNTEYIILGSLLWKLLGKKIGFWYAHGRVDLKLKVAEFFSDIIFTSTKSGFGLPSKKMNIIGQGIDMDKFVPIKKTKDDIFRLIAVGRISPIKGYDMILDALNIVKDKIKPFKLVIIGGVVMSEHELYFRHLQDKVKLLGLSNFIDFIGPLPNYKIIPYLQNSDLMINASSTGSLDKVMVEAMACGVPVITCNESIKEVLNNDWFDYFFNRDSYSLVEKILLFYNNRNNLDLIGGNLSSKISDSHSLKKLIQKIIDIYEEN